MHQHHDYVEIARRQTASMAGVVQYASRIQPGSVIVVLDRERRSRAWSPCSLASDCLTNALRYIYDDLRFEAIVCFAHPADPFAEACRFTPAGLTVSYLARADGHDVQRSYAYDVLIVFQYADATGIRLLERLDGRDGSPTAGAGYRPRARFEPGPAPDRARRVFPGGLVPAGPVSPSSP
jgi:hypothetical protein